MHIPSAAPAPSQPFIPWRHALTLILAPLALFSSKAHAEEKKGWEATVGAGGFYAPDYEGSNDLEVLPFPFISVTYNDLFYIQGPELGLNLLRLHPTDDLSIKAGPLARYRRDRSEKRNRDLRGLGKVDMAIEVGGAARVDYRNWHLGLSLAKDSGSPGIDRSVLNTIRGVAPFAPLPTSVTDASFTFTVPIRYTPAR